MTQVKEEASMTDETEPDGDGHTWVVETPASVSDERVTIGVNRCTRCGFTRRFHTYRVTTFDAEGRTTRKRKCIRRKG